MPLPANDDIFKKMEDHLFDDTDEGAELRATLTTGILLDVARGVTKFVEDRKVGAFLMSLRAVAFREESLIPALLHAAVQAALKNNDYFVATTMFEVSEDRLREIWKDCKNVTEAKKALGAAIGGQRITDIHKRGESIEDIIDRLAEQAKNKNKEQASDEESATPTTRSVYDALRNRAKV